jgi:hypothetical protein
MIIVATFFVLAAWLAFVWIVDPDDFTKRTSKRMARPPFPPRDNKSGGSNVYTVYFGPPGSGRLPHPSGNKWPSKSFVDFPEALLWAHGAAAKGTVITGIEGAGVDLDRNQVAACLSALSISNRAAHSIGG